jgi:hypothetical protein
LVLFVRLYKDAARSAKHKKKVGWRFASDNNDFTYALVYGLVPSVQQKSCGLKFSKSRNGSHMTYSCHHNSSRFTFPQKCSFVALLCLPLITIIHSRYILQSINHGIYYNQSLTHGIYYNQSRTVYITINHARYILQSITHIIYYNQSRTVYITINHSQYILQSITHGIHVC